jgi:hypothetical protein
VRAGRDEELMAPGFGTPEELATSKAAADYWARPAGT